MNTKLGLKRALGTLALVLLPAGFPAYGAEHGPGMAILDVVYGNQNQVCFATGDVQAACDGDSYCQVEADNGLCGDPAQGTRKRLVVTYSCGDGIRTIQVDEGEVATAYCVDPGRLQAAAPEIPGFQRCRNRRDCPPRGSGRNQLWVSEAAYGAGDRYCDATGTFQDYCDGRAQCSVAVGNDLCGDPAEGLRKVAEIDYYCNGRLRHDRTPEDHVAELSCP